MGQDQSKFTRSSFRKTTLRSSPRRRRSDPEVLNLMPHIIQLNKHIEDVKLEIYKTRAKGIKKREEFNYQIDKLELDIFKKRKKLMHMGSESIPFNEYVSIIQRSFQSPTQPAKSIFREDADKCKAIVPQYNTVSYTLLGFFEAFLLKRMHVAMLQRKQQGIHSETWSKLVADLYYEIPALKKKFEEREISLSTQIKPQEENLTQLQGAYIEYLRIQEKGIRMLEEAPWYGEETYEYESELKLEPESMYII